MKENNFPGGFAVLMTVYQGDNHSLFKMAVNSVLANSLPPSQFLIVVDGPIHSALEQTIKSFSQHYGDRIEFLRLPTNQGLANALNEGLSYVRYPWVVRADADDFNLPHRFSSLAELVINTPELGLLSSNILEVDRFNNPIAIRSVPILDIDIRRFAKSRSPFNHMAVAYRLESVLACGGYPKIYLKEDYALWCIMLANDVLSANVNDVLVHATTGIDMYRRRGGWRYARAEWEMQAILVTSGLKGKYSALICGILRAVVFLVPAFFRGWIYVRFLRKKID